MNFALLLLGISLWVAWAYAMLSRRARGAQILARARAHHPQYHKHLLSRRTESYWVLAPKCVPERADIPADARLRALARSWWRMNATGELLWVAATIVLALALTL